LTVNELLPDCAINSSFYDQGIYPIYPLTSHKGIRMTSRRQFIKIVPIVPAALLVGCSEKAAAPPAPPAAPTPPPSPTPLAAPAAAAPAAPAASAALLPLVDEKDATAAALGFVLDATKANTAKYKTYAAGQACSNCVLYQPIAGSEQGGCPLFAGRNVPAKGWCSSYAKKPA
jgi:High potential iron-sulfur protein